LFIYNNIINIDIQVPIFLYINLINLHFSVLFLIILKGKNLIAIFFLYKNKDTPQEMSENTIVSCHFNKNTINNQLKMPRAGIEPATRGFSVLCSTD
jgi:hypothetical protein